MCTRYTLHKMEAAIAAVAEALGRDLPPPPNTKPRYNVAITNVVPVVALDDGRPSVREMGWGLLPFSGGGQSHRHPLANARAETVNTLPSFKAAVERRRCLVPANGFYEWRKAGARREPHLFTLRDEEPFAFAAIWDLKVEAPSPPLPDAFPPGGTASSAAFSEAASGSFCILTTTPNALAAPIHDRMPVILTGAAMAAWLGDRPLPDADLRELTRPYPADRMTVRPVNRFVGNSRNEGPQCHALPEEPEPELPFGDRVH